MNMDPGSKAQFESGTDCILKFRAEKADRSSKRRTAANARERRRMQGLNAAFERLRKVVPQWGEDIKLSKYETLQMALSYIVALARVLSEEESCRPDREWTQLQREHVYHELYRTYATAQPLCADAELFTSAAFPAHFEQFTVTNGEMSL